MRDFELEVRLLDSSGSLFKKASYDLFKVGPGPDFALDVSDYTSDPNTFVRDAFFEVICFVIRKYWP